MKSWRNTHRVSSVALTNENLLRRASRTDFGEAGGRRLRCLAGFYPLQTHLKKDSTAGTPPCAVLGIPYACQLAWSPLHRQEALDFVRPYPHSAHRKSQRIVFISPV